MEGGGLGRVEFEAVAVAAAARSMHRPTYNLVKITKLAPETKGRL